MPEGAKFQRAFAQTILARRPQRGTPPAFAVYRNTWLKALLDALASNYPTVAMILGDNAFEAVALDFARKHPATTPVLALYGAEFADFLRGHGFGRAIPYLRDVARLERMWTECFFAGDAPILEEHDYAALKPAQLLKLEARVHPATRAARFETPAVTIWAAHRAEREFEVIEPQWDAERALVTRRRGAVSVSLVDEPALHMLAAMTGGRSLGWALGATCDFYPEADLSKSLAMIISTGALSIKTPEDDRIW